MARTSDGSSDLFKKQIEVIVGGYKKKFMAEYVLVVDAIRRKRERLFDGRFGTAPDSNADGRMTVEVPETLHNMLVAGLSPEGLTWFTSAASTPWFTRTFPEFKLPKEI